MTLARKVLRPAARRLPRPVKSSLGRLHPSLETFLGASPWPRLAAGSRALLDRIPANGPAVLCATSVGGQQHVRAVDGLVAAALRLRGAQPHLLLCDQALAACELAAYSEYSRPQDFAEHGPKRRYCGECFGSGADYLRGVPAPLRTYRQYISPAEIAQAGREAAGRSLAECFAYEWQGIPLGESVRCGVLRFFGNSAIDREDPALLLAAARRYLAGALVTAQVGRRAIEALRPVAIVTHHGVYVPQGVLGAVARHLGVRVVTWAPSYRNTTVIYSHGDTYHRTFPAEARANWEAMPWDAEREAQIEQYLQQRRRGQGDWSWMTLVGSACRLEDRRRIAEELGLDPAQPTAGLLTNIGWDADIFHAGRAFDDMFEWVVATIDFFAAHPGWQLIIRVHPHEVKGGNRQLAAEEIRRLRPDLPPNVKLVPHDSPLSTYALMENCNMVLAWGTKTAIELAPTGVPVVVTADAWTRNKDISYDVASREEYLALLERLPELERSSPERLERARRYAYHFFFRRMIPLKAMDPTAEWPPRLRLQCLDEILPGRDPGLDVICEGILTGREFIYSP
jgi:hypothetical protein